MEETSRPDEPLMGVQATERELLAVNLAIAYFMRYYSLTTPAWSDTCALLTRFQQQIDAQIVTNLYPTPEYPGGLADGEGCSDAVDHKNL